MGIFSRLPLQQIMVASVLGVLSGLYIFAPGIIEFSSQIQKKNVDESGQDLIQDGGQTVLENKTENV
jgi:hypothetical protein